MQINIKKNLKQYSFWLIGIILICLIGLFIYQNIKLYNILKEKPQDIVVANISINSAEIYWKSDVLLLPSVMYKKSTDTGLYTKVTAGNTNIYHDLTQNKYIYRVRLTKLEPNTTYVFRIDTPGENWRDDTYKFSTLDYSVSVSVPDIVTGKSSLKTFVLVVANNKSYMFDTQYHGTWAGDLGTKAYTATDYASYKTETELKNELSSFLGNIVTPVYAMQGANCKVGIIPSYTSMPTKVSSVNLANAWVASCKLGNYADECYDDTYCQSKRAGIDPAFAIAMWIHESDASNYAKYPIVEDFGIHHPDVNALDYTTQIQWFLRNIGYHNSYIYGCDMSQGELAAWGARYLTGGCTADRLDDGLAYVSSIEGEYEYLTNQILQWDNITIPAITNACDYSNATTNNHLNTCDAKNQPNGDPVVINNYNNGVGGWTDPNADDDSGGGNNDGGDNGGNDLPERTVLTVNGRDMYCRSSQGCVCKYASGETQFNISNGYTCPATYTGKGVLTTQICCKTNNSVSTQWPYSCNGTIINSIGQVCAMVEKAIFLSKGTNFIQASDIVNTAEVSISSAKSLISYTNNKVIVVGLYRNDRWEKLVKYDNGVISGEDFNLEPGESYLVITTEDVTVNVKALPSGSNLNLDSLSGWNLIPASTFKSTTLTTKNILQDSKYADVKQIATWDENLGTFKYTIKDSNGNIYGESTAIPSSTSFFVKIITN